MTTILADARRRLMIAESNVTIGESSRLVARKVFRLRGALVGTSGDAASGEIFMRKKNIDAHIGGMVVQLEQDPETGAIVSCTPRIYRYFNKDYYNDRWARDGKVVLPNRRIA